MKKCMASLVLFFLTLNSAMASLPYTPISFPRDEAAHHINVPYDYQRLIEWWYFNGKLTTDEGRQFGFDTAMFNVAYKFGNMVTGRPMLHIQVADLDNKKAVGTGKLYDKNTGHFDASKLDIQVNQDFSLKKMTVGGKEVYVLKAMGVENNTKINIDFVLEPKMEPFLINGNGLMDMPNDTNSYYYTIPTFKLTGTLTINGEVHHVTKNPGEGWMDHQWGDFSVGDYGWEWFSIRLENGLIADLFINTDNKTHKVVNGLANIILPSGEKRFIPYEKFEVKRKDYWHDKENGVDYPQTFIFNFPELGLQIENSSYFPEQEIHGYWEGYATVKSVYGGKNVVGFSYTEIVY